MRFYFRISVLVLALVVAGTALAATTVPNTFTNGTVADADEVNENFNALSTAIDNIPAGPAGPAGISCWDLNENGVKDPDEDLNKDNVVDVLDCRPAELYREPEQRTWYVNSRLLLNLMGDTSDDHYLPIYESRLPECAFPDELSANVDCLKDPIPDPCGLWQWEKTGSGGDDDTWYVRATQGFNFRTISFEVLVPPSDPSDPVHYGWEDCREACLVDPQCVGASIERVLEVDNALSCKLIARSSASDNSEVAFRNNAVGPRQVQANNWASRDSILFAEAILSVCPTPTTP